MKEEIKIGDIVETCQLMPGIVMSIEDDDVEVRIIGKNYEYNGGGFNWCSIPHCGIRKIDDSFAMKLLFLGQQTLGELYRNVEEVADQNRFYKEYDNSVEQAYQARLKYPEHQAS